MRRLPHALLVAALGSMLVASSVAGQSPSASPAASPAASVPASDPVLDRVRSSGTLRVAGPIAIPFVIQAPDGSYDGFDVALLTLFAEELGVSLEMIPAGFDTVVAGLQTDQWDLVPGLCNTEARREVIDFSDASVEYKTQWYFRADNPKTADAQTVADLDKPEITVAVGTGTAGAELAAKLLPNATIKSVPGMSDPDSLQQVLSGRVDAVPIDWPVLPAAIAVEYPGVFRFIPEDMTNEPTGCPVAWGVPKGAPAFLAAINGFLAARRADGKFDEIQATYFSPDFVKLTP